MTSRLSHRLVAALASMVITFTLFSAVVSEAGAPGAVPVAMVPAGAAALG